WMPTVPLVDLRAQIVVALVQLGCIPIPTGIECLKNYIKDNYRIPHNGATRSETQQDRESVSFLLAVEVVKRWCFPENALAFRSYVKRSMGGVLRGSSGVRDQPHGSLEIDPNDNNEYSDFEGPRFDPRETGSTPWQSSLS